MKTSSDEEINKAIAKFTDNGDCYDGCVYDGGLCHRNHVSYTSSLDACSPIIEKLGKKHGIKFTIEFSHYSFSWTCTVINGANLTAITKDIASKAVSLALFHAIGEIENG